MSASKLSLNIVKLNFVIFYSPQRKLPFHVTLSVDGINLNQEYSIFNIRFKGPKVWNSISENLKTFSISNFKESVKSNFVKDY